MDELLRLKERVDLAIELGESHYREFKSALEGPSEAKKPRNLKEIFSDVAKTLVAFANADGGELFVGIEDDNRITGLPYDSDEISALLKAPENYVLRETPLPLKRLSLIDYEGKKIAYFSVEKGSQYVHMTSKGECFQRKDRASAPTASEAIRLPRDEELSKEYDRRFADFASVGDLDLMLIESLSKSIFRSISPEKFLQYMGLVEFDGTRLRLRNAALLLFAKNASKWHPRPQIRILKVRGTEEKSGADFNMTEIGEINGNIFCLIDQSIELLKAHLTETRFSSDAMFRAQMIYPEAVCREVIVNAVTHRDYSQEGRGIEIKIFDDRLEVQSPGKLLSPVTIQDLEELRGLHQSRNVHVSRVLRELGYVQELGEGVRRMFELMKSNSMPAPRMESPNKSFLVKLYHK